MNAATAANSFHRRRKMLIRSTILIGWATRDQGLVPAAWTVGAEASAFEALVSMVLFTCSGSWVAAGWPFEGKANLALQY